MTQKYNYIVVPLLREEISMKTLVKLISINDGDIHDHHNGDWLHVQSYPRAEKIVSTFFDEGWFLVNRTPRYYPAPQQAGEFSFYIGGWDFLFSKDVLDDDLDDSDKFLDDLINKILDDESDETPDGFFSFE
jgi:hypothetical protein